jgi:hypothetical protein
MNRLPSIIADRMELPWLVMLQDQKVTLSRLRKQQANGMATIAAGGPNGVAIATTPTTAANTSAAEDEAIHNRCSTNNYYLNQDAGPGVNQPQPNHYSRIPGWVIVSLLVGVIGAAVIWWALTHPPQPAPLPANPVAPAPGNQYWEVR